MPSKANAQRDQLIIELYHERKTYNHIAGLVGLTPERVRQIINRPAIRRATRLADANHLHVRTNAVLRRAGLTPEHTRQLPDEALLRLVGFGPVGLADLRARYPQL